MNTGILNSVKNNKLTKQNIFLSCISYTAGGTSTQTGQTGKGKSNKGKDKTLEEFKSGKLDNPRDLASGMLSRVGKAINMSVTWNDENAPFPAGMRVHEHIPSSRTNNDDQLVHLQVDCVRQQVMTVIPRHKHGIVNSTCQQHCFTV